MKDTRKYFKEINNLTPEHFQSKEKFLENFTEVDEEILLQESIDKRDAEEERLWEERTERQP